MNVYQERLKKLMDEYAHYVYKICKNFPDDERFGITSQIKRSSVSVILNYIEGYSRRKSKVRLNFLEISYGSLKESKYLLYFSLKENFLSKDNYLLAYKLSEEISAMLWTEIINLENKI
jgi:four helix bundle protein